MRCVLTKMSLYMKWPMQDGLCISKLDSPLIRDQWYNLAQKLNEVVINGDQDRVMWKWWATRKFTIKPVYNHLTKNDNGHAYRNIWKSKLPKKNHFLCGYYLKGLC
jgi:hypothetical protein